jgi:polyphosphate kinase 2 (PPK2 family)
MDATEKDSTIKHAMTGINPKDVSVTSFKKLSKEELEHDFLWRYLEQDAQARSNRNF